MAGDWRYVDRYGLSKNNTYLVVHLPAYDSALVFRVRERLNDGYEKFIFGQLPITSGQTFNLYAGGSVTAPAAGIFPGVSYMALNQGVNFAAPTIGGQQLQTFDTTDMWYLPSDQSDILFEVRQLLTPAWLRVAVSIPTGQQQSGFQRNKVAGGVNTSNAAFGFKRGEMDIFQIPKIHYGYHYGNDSNPNVNTRVVFVYGEYLVEIPKDPGLLFDLIEGLAPARHVAIPVQTKSQLMDTALAQDYGAGFSGFKVYELSQRDQAITDYANVIAGGLNI